MKKLIVGFCLLALSFGSIPSIAAPNKVAADKWYADFRKSKDKALDALAINKPDKYQSIYKEISALKDRSVKLFGEPMTSDLARCTSSVMSLEDVWTNIAVIGATGKLDKMTPAFIAQSAWSGGDDQSTCRDEIEKLK